MVTAKVDMGVVIKVYLYHRLIRLQNINHEASHIDTYIYISGAGLRNFFSEGVIKKKKNRLSLI